MYAGWQADQDAAEEKFRLIGDVSNGWMAERGKPMSRWVEAEADTGSRYAVMVTWLPEEVRRREGGQVLVSVVWPWQDCKVMQDDGYLDQSYVAEHLTAGRAAEKRLHGGDLKALTMTIQHALGRVDNDG